MHVCSELIGMVACGSSSGHGIQFHKKPGYTTTFVTASAATPHTGDKLSDSVVLLVFSRLRLDHGQSKECKQYP